MMSFILNIDISGSTTKTLSRNKKSERTKCVFCLLTLDHSQRKKFRRKKIPEFNCIRKETVDKDIHLGMKKEKPRKLSE